MKNKAVGMEEFHQVIRKESSIRNCGVTTRYSSLSRTTYWILGGVVVGVSAGVVGNSGHYVLML